MPDFDFRGLSARSFEQLVVDLATADMGSGAVTPFGDGPDGGREATFNGRIKYSTTGEQWDGYGVVQAKFLTRPSSTGSDGSWLLTELRSELSEYTRAGTRRKMPEYYLLCTNVVLSAVPDTGGKDRVMAELEGFASKHGLKGWDIWDYDKLGALLRIHEPVRRTYSAWITPGDVLSTLLDTIESGRPHLDRLVAAFLQKEFAADQYAHLEQAGHAADERIPLANVFIDVPAAIGQTRPRYASRSGYGDNRFQLLQHIMELARERFSPTTVDSSSQSKESYQVDGDTPVNRLVVVGGPGQGKTTVAQFVCQMFRAAILTEASDTLVEYEVRTELRSFLRACEEAGLELPAARRFPVRVVLSRIAAWMARSADNKSIMRYLLEQFNATSTEDLAMAEFRSVLSSYPLIVIFDGLDEVPASSNREQVLTAIRNFLVDLATENVDVVTIATSRPQGYNDDFSPRAYRHVTLLPLNKAEAIRYATRLAQIRFGADTVRVEKVVDRVCRAAEDESSARLMETPLQVTILTLLVDRTGQAPRERWNLFNEYYTLMYSRELERDIPSAQILRDQKTNIEAIHRSTALLLQVESERSGSTDARLTRAQFEAVVRARLGSEGYAGSELAALTEAIIAGAAQRLVFLVGLEEDEVGFEIRSLQEFMAAEGLLDGPDGVVQERLRRLAASGNWRNVYLFAVGKCFAVRQYLRDTVVATCVGMNDDPADASLRWIKAGSLLALDILEDGSAQRQPSYRASLTQLATSLLKLGASASTALRLASVFKYSDANVFMQELRLALDSTDETILSGAVVCLAALTEDETPETKELAESVFSLAALETAEWFVPLAAALGGRSWLSSRAAAAAEHREPEVIVRMARSGDSLSSSWLDAPEGSAASMLLSLTSPRKIRRDLAVRLYYGRRRCPDVVLTSLGRWSEADCRPLVNSQGEGLGWMAVRSMAEFAVDPSPARLGATIRNLDAWAVDRSELKQSIISALATWPVAACWAYVRRCGDGEAVARAAEGGDFGGVEEWMAAEARWVANGTTIAEVQASESRLGPLAADLGRSGFASWAVIEEMVGGNGPRTTGALAAILEQEELLRDTPFRSWIVAEFLASSRGRRQRSRAATIAALRVAAESTWWYPSYLLVESRSLSVASLSEEEYALLDAVGRRLADFGIRLIHEDREWLSIPAAGLRFPGVAALAMYAAISSRAPMPDLTVEAAEPSDAALVAFLRLCRSAYLGETVTAADWTFGASPADVSRASSVVDAYLAGPGGAGMAEGFVGSLIGEASGSGMILRGMLESLVAMRLSCLCERASWNSLQLPAELAEVCFAG